MFDASQLPSPIATDDFFTQEQYMQPRDLVRTRVDFALRCLTHIQELVRFMDQKAGFTLSAVGILTTAQGAFLLRLLNTAAVSPAQQVIYFVALGCALVYMLAAFGVIFAGTRVFTPSVAPRQRNSQAHGLIFPLTILARHKADESLYHQQLMRALPSDLLLDLSNQIVEVSAVFAAKNKHLAAMFRRLRALCILWLALMLLLVLSNVVP